MLLSLVICWKLIFTFKTGIQLVFLCVACLPSIINYACPNFRTTCARVFTFQHEFELSTLSSIPPNSHIGGLCYFLFSLTYSPFLKYCGDISYHVSPTRLGVYWSLIILFFKCGRNVNKPGQQWFNIINTTDKTIFLAPVDETFYHKI
jgi:hypothetical protein